MELSDIQTIKEIDVKSFSLSYSSDVWEREKQNSLSRTLVALHDREGGVRELCGYLNFWIILDEAEIHRLAVKKEYRRSGVAAKLLQEMFGYLHDKGIVSVRLEVRQSNHEAIKLYEKFGFMIKGRRRGYYQETGEDALVLEVDPKPIKKT